MQGSYRVARAATLRATGLIYACAAPLLMEGFVAACCCRELLPRRLRLFSGPLRAYGETLGSSRWQATWSWTQQFSPATAASWFVKRSAKVSLGLRADLGLQDRWEKFLQTPTASRLLWSTCSLSDILQLPPQVLWLLAPSSAAAALRLCNQLGLLMACLVTVPRGLGDRMLLESLELMPVQIAKFPCAISFPIISQSV